MGVTGIKEENKSEDCLDLKQYLSTLYNLGDLLNDVPLEAINELYGDRPHYSIPVVSKIKMLPGLFDSQDNNKEKLDSNMEEIDFDCKVDELGALNDLNKFLDEHSALNDLNQFLDEQKECQDNGGIIKETIDTDKMAQDLCRQIIGELKNAINKEKATEETQSGRYVIDETEWKEKKFKEYTEEMYDIFVKKNSDYSANETVGSAFDFTYNVLGPLAPAVRFLDKICRYISLSSGKEQMVSDEKIKDTLTDLANYALLTRLKIEWDEKLKNK